MYQTVMLLLVTAVITIITTVVTVRLTMTGRVVSQEHKQRLTTIARRYGILMINVLGLPANLWALNHNMNRTSPIDRGDILAISITVGSIYLGVFGIAAGCLLVWQDR